MTKSDQRAMKMLATAMEMEEKGGDFYEKAMKETKSAAGKDIWRMLRADEIIHRERIKNIYDSLEAGKGWKKKDFSKKAGVKKLESFFNKLGKKNAPSIKAETSDLKAIDVGLDFETRSIKFYQKQLTAATEELEREFLKRMIAEENSHFTALQDMKLFLIDPSSWFSSKEGFRLMGPTA